MLSIERSLTNFSDIVRRRFSLVSDTQQIAKDAPEILGHVKQGKLSVSKPRRARHSLTLRPPAVLLTG
jgi:hypothetical protein